MLKKDVVLFSLSASKRMGKEIALKLGIKEGEVFKSHFADGEILTHPTSSVRGKDVFVVQSTSKPVNENLMELLIFLDALKRASAKTINLIIPYYGYARQDRKAQGRQPITAKLIADLIQCVGVARVIICDLHAEQIQGFFNVPVDDLRAASVLIDAMLKKEKPKGMVVVSPDNGGIKRNRKIAESLGIPLAIIDKRRPKPNVAEATTVLGDVKGKTAIIVDDMIDTGGTIVSACELIKQHGAKDIFVLATHGLFNGQAVTRLGDAIKHKIITKVYVSNSIEITTDKKFKGLETISIAPFLADIIKAIIQGDSISKVYNEYASI